jgi:uncharacterized protein
MVPPEGFSLRISWEKVAYCETKRGLAQKFYERSICRRLGELATMGPFAVNRCPGMNLIRILVIALIVWLVYRMIQRTLAKPEPEKPADAKLATDMVRCAHCGIHIPKNEALQRDGFYYCSEQHLEAGPCRE